MIVHPIFFAIITHRPHLLEVARYTVPQIPLHSQLNVIAHEQTLHDVENCVQTDSPALNAGTQTEAH